MSTFNIGIVLQVGRYAHHSGPARLHCRYLHMRAYFCMFTGKTDKAVRLLKDAVLLADGLTNALDREWAKHSLYVSHKEGRDRGWKCMRINVLASRTLAFRVTSVNKM